MSLTAITEMGTRSGGLQMEGLRRTYTRTYQVFTSGAAVEPLEILTGSTSLGVRLPRIGESYVGPNGYYDTGAIVDDFAIQQPNDDHPDYWLVTVIWRSFPSNLTQNTQSSGGGSPSSPQTSNPLFQPPKVTWGTRKKIKALLHTIARPELATIPLTGGRLLPDPDKVRPVVNSAGSAYEPAPQKEISYRTMTIVRNEPEFRPFTSQRYVGSVNSHTFQTQPPGCAFCDDVDGEFAYQDGIFYFVVTYRFSFAPLDEATGNPDPFFWYTNLLDRGPRYRDADGTLKPYKDKLGVAGSQVFLASDGKIFAGFNIDTGQLDPSFGVPSIIFPDHDGNDFGDFHLPDPAFL